MNARAVRLAALVAFTSVALKPCVARAWDATGAPARGAAATTATTATTSATGAPLVGIREYIGMWTPAEVARISSLHVSKYDPSPGSLTFASDPSANRPAADDAKASRLRGEVLFFSQRMSRSGTLSCATCHFPETAFSAGPEARRTMQVGGVGAPLDTPSLVALGERTWFGIGGSSDSLPARVLFAWRNPEEHALTLQQIAVRVQEVAPDGSKAEESTLAAETTAWRAAQDVATFVLGLAPGASRFDDYAVEVEQAASSVTLSAAEERGLRLFLGKGQCVRCHFGPTFSNGFFHNTGTVLRQGVDRFAGLTAARADAFNCIRRKRDGCAEFTRARDSWENQGAIRTPSLRDVSRTAPYFHDGSAASLEDVVEHYVRAPRALVGASEILPVSFSERDRADLVAFLKSLDSRDASWQRVARRHSAREFSGNESTKGTP